MTILQLQERPVPGQQHWTETFPLVLQPLEKPEDFSAVEKWLAREHQELLDQLTRHGAILLRNLPIDDALQIALEVADALSYAHSRDVVHRDTAGEVQAVSIYDQVAGGLSGLYQFFEPEAEASSPGRSLAPGGGA